MTQAQKLHGDCGVGSFLSPVTWMRISPDDFRCTEEHDKTRYREKQVRKTVTTSVCPVQPSCIDPVLKPGEQQTIGTSLTSAVPRSMVQSDEVTDIRSTKQEETPYYELFTWLSSCCGVCVSHGPLLISHLQHQSTFTEYSAHRRLWRRLPCSPRSSRSWSSQTP